jgi:hypothetical protein
MLWASAKPAIANTSMSWDYNIMLKRIAASVFALALAVSPALAGSSTIAVTPGSGATYQVITNGGGNFVGMFGLCDGVAAAQCVAVKAASTAALAADPSLVVTISPNTATLPVSGTFWQTTQPVSGTFWQTTQPISAASLPLPTGAATAAGLTTINTTLGSPFQAGGSIGNTSFAATQSGSWSLVNISGTVSLPTGAATSANQTNASQKTQIVDGSGNVIASTSNNLDVQCANCSGSGVSTADGASWTAGTSLFAGIGGAYQTTVTSNPLTAGDQGFAQLTHYRALMTAWFNSSGTEMGTSGSPVQVSLANTGANGTALAVNPAIAANWAILADNAAWTVSTTPQTAIGCEYTSGGATALTTGHVGTPGCTSARAIFTDKSSVGGTALVASVSAYGTPPTGTEVEGVNAFITNTNANGSATSANSAPVVIASDQAAVATKAASGVFVAGAIADLAHGQGTMAASVPVAIASNQSAMPTSGAVNVTPTDCSVTLTTGGTAQNAFTAQTTLHGFTISNIDATSGSGEPVWFSFTGTAVAGAAGSYPLAAPTATTFANPTSYTTPPGFGTNHALSVIAATTSHKISCTWW